jgi:predicted histidine transporter YuiF (NhaC family)
MNSVVIAISLMLVLSLCRVNVVIALTVSALAAGALSPLSLNQTIEAFNAGLGHNAQIALSYATLGAFAMALSHSGVTDVISQRIINQLGNKTNYRQKLWIKTLLMSAVLLMAISSQNIIPVHIAFIPILIPPLLSAMNMLAIDRRAIACIIAFGLVTTYMIVPFGFGHIFLNEILGKQIELNGLPVSTPQIIQAMTWPVIGMFLGLLTAVFFSYRKPRRYQVKAVEIDPLAHTQVNPSHLRSASLAIMVTLGIQIFLDDALIFAALAGFIILHTSGVLKRHNTEDVITQGFHMMAVIGFTMIAAAGFAEVIQTTGDIESLVESIRHNVGSDNKGLVALMMLVIGLLITMGIGSSFSTIPILAAIYVPLALSFDFSTLATIALIGTSAALGDAGSPASESTLVLTAGLNADEQHEHIYDSVVPTFLHFNLPLMVFGWIAAMTL